jgi:hypothetical protein
MTDRLREQAKHALQVVTTDGHPLSAGKAVLFALQEIGWHPLLARLGQLPPFIWLVELGYWVVARNRPFFSRFLSASGGGTVRCGKR